jgi:hypothetical protein
MTPEQRSIHRIYLREHNRHLTHVEVDEIRHAYRNGLGGYKQIGAWYGIKPETVRNIVKRRTYADVREEHIA